MTEFRAGQRVRIEWPDGDFFEGIIHRSHGKHYTVHGGICVDGLRYRTDGRVVTVLSEPRPQEPTGIGAVVVAATPPNPVRRNLVSHGEGVWWVVDVEIPECYRWDYLVDPVVLSEGLT